MFKFQLYVLPLSLSSSANPLKESEVIFSHKFLGQIIPLVAAPREAGINPQNASNLPHSTCQDCKV